MVARCLALVFVAALSLASLPAVFAQGTETVPDDVQRVIEALFADDEAAVETLLAFTPVPCQAGEPSLESPQPRCPAGAAPGDPVDAFPRMACEGLFFAADDVGNLRQALAASGPKLEGVFRVSAGESSFMVGDYAAVFRSRDAVLMSVWISDGRISSLHEGCGDGPQTIEEYADFFQLEGPLAPGTHGLPDTGSGAASKSSSGSALAIAAVVGLLPWRWREAP